MALLISFLSGGLKLAAPLFEWEGAWLRAAAPEWIEEFTADEKSWLLSDLFQERDLLELFLRWEAAAWWEEVKLWVLPW